MTETFDLIIRNATLRGENKTTDIAVAGGKIAKIAPKIAGSAGKEIEAHGNLVTESFVNTHLHLCKVYTLMMMDDVPPMALRMPI